jgi:hypothetical protein
MSGLLKRKSTIEKLEQKYADLMRKSFKVALKDCNESEKVQKQAYKVLMKLATLHGKKLTSNAFNAVF